MNIEKNAENKSAEQLRELFAAMDVRTHQAEQDVLELTRFIQRFQEIDRNIKALEAYYHDSWLEDVEAWEHLQAKAVPISSDELANEHFYCTGQDAIWNAAQDFYAQKIKLLKILANSI